MDFPLTCLRGLRASSWLNGPNVTAKAFLPDTSTSAVREDRCSEAAPKREPKQLDLFPE